MSSHVAPVNLPAHVHSNESPTSAQAPPFRHGSIAHVTFVGLDDGARVFSGPGPHTSRPHGHFGHP